MTVTVTKNTDVVINLQGFDLDGDSLTVTITSLPSAGSLYQLSQVFNDYGYEPKRGSSVTSNTVVSGSNQRIIYSPPPNRNAPVGKWASFTYTVTDGTTTSHQGIVSLVSSDRVLVGSRFDNNAEGWSIDNNGVGGAGVFYEPTSRGALNHYIWSRDTNINVNTPGGSDKDQWMFRAPSKFLGNQVIAYGGAISFWMSSASGDFAASNRNSGDDLIELVCTSCASQKGIRLVRRMSQGTVFNGSPTFISIPLVESSWLKDSKNTLVPFAAPTACELAEVLEGLTSFRILGDFTKWYESVSIDKVEISHGAGVPLACYAILK